MVIEMARSLSSGDSRLALGGTPANGVLLVPIDNLKRDYMWLFIADVHRDGQDRKSPPPHGPHRFSGGTADFTVELGLSHETTPEIKGTKTDKKQKRPPGGKARRPKEVRLLK